MLAVSACIAYHAPIFLFVDSHVGLIHANAGMAAFTVFLVMSTMFLWCAVTRRRKSASRGCVYLDGFDHLLVTLRDYRKVHYDASKVMPIHRLYQQYPQLCVLSFAVIPRWKNAGRTPTKNMTIQVDWAPVVDDAEPTTTWGSSRPKFTYHLPPQPFFVPAGAVENSESVDIPLAQQIVTDRLIKLPSMPDLQIVIWGRADYQDVFNKHHFIEWCYQIQFSADSLNALRVNFIRWHEYHSASA